MCEIWFGPLKIPWRLCSVSLVELDVEDKNAEFVLDSSGSFKTAWNLKKQLGEYTVLFELVFIFVFLTEKMIRNWKQRVDREASKRRLRHYPECTPTLKSK